MTYDRFGFLEFGQPTDPEAQTTSSTDESAKPDAGAGVSGGERRRNKARQVDQSECPAPYDPPQSDPFRRGLTTIQTSGSAASFDPIEIKVAEVFGTKGAGIGEFNYPVGVAVDNAGILFVADVHNHRVQRITPDGGVSIIGTRGVGRMQFIGPTGVAVDEYRSFYIVEQGNARVQKFSFDGLLELTFGRQGVKAGEFRAPTGICVSPATGEILVADTGNKRVQRFTMSGQYIGSLGAAGTVQPPLANPQSIACDHIGNIYVADTSANRIARYDPLGRFTGHFGGVLPSPMTPLAPNVRFSQPQCLACNTRGEIFVGDTGGGTGQVVVLTSDTGQVRTTITDPGRGIGRLSRPCGIAIGPRVRLGNSDGIPRADLYVADTMNHRIIRFTCT
jgi:DNA-binding beta-propeller fold protein YncE